MKAVRNTCESELDGIGSVNRMNENYFKRFIWIPKENSLSERFVVKVFGKNSTYSLQLYYLAFSGINLLEIKS